MAPGRSSRRRSDGGGAVSYTHLDVYKRQQLGIDYVCGTSLVAEDIFSKVVSGHGAHIDTFGEFEVLRFSLDLSSTDKRTIRVGELERDHDVRIIAFERSDGSASSIPTRDSILYNGDSVQMCIRDRLPPIRFMRWRYELSSDYLDIAKGIVWRKRFVIPFIRVQNTDTRQGPILRAFGLSSVTVATAAGEHEIPGLGADVAEQLRDRAAELARLAQEDV